MENSGFTTNHLPSQALVVLSEAASGLHEALRNQRPFQTRVHYPLPDAKDLHNMSLVGNYGTHLLHSFHPHLLQSLNPSILAGGNPGGFFSGDRSVVKPVLSSFQLPSAFSPPKYIGVSLDQGLFSGSSESFRTDSTSPTCASLSPLTKTDSLEGHSGEYDGDKGESPRSNSDSREFRHIHIKTNPRTGVPDACPVCGVQLSVEEWNTHFLTELDRLYKLSSGMDRTSIQQSCSFSPCPSQENSIRSSHSRWETFQRIRTNRQSRLRIKVRKRKCGNDLYFLENLFCNSCPICRRKFPLDNVKNFDDDRHHVVKDEVETVDVESCSDDVPDSGSDVSGTNKIEGVLYKSVCLINKDGGDDVTNSWESNSHMSGMMSQYSRQLYQYQQKTYQLLAAKNANNGLSSTTQQFYNPDSCEDRGNSEKDADTNLSNNDSDEDVIVDDDSVKTTRKRKFDDESRRTENNSPEDDRQSEPQVTSTEQPESSNRYPVLEELRARLRELESPSLKTGKEDDEYKCFICKKGLEKYSNFFRGRTLYFHQSCANVMSSHRSDKTYV